jgi:hypothetical protein
MLTEMTSLQNFTDEDKSLSNIRSQESDICCNAYALGNKYLGGKTIALAEGGKAIPS